MWHLSRSRRGARRPVAGVARSEVIRLAWPIASAMLGEALMGLIDTKLVSDLGAAALGGVGVASSLFHLSYITVLGLMRGVKVCTAHAVGAGEGHHGTRYAMTGVALGLCTGLLFACLFRQAGAMLALMHIHPDLVDPAERFLRARCWGLPAACALAALIEHRQGIGDVRAPMLVGLAGNVINAGLAWALIYGHAGLPALGVEGAGIGTSITEALQVLALLVLLAAGAWRRRRQAPISRLLWSKALRDLLAVGVPTAIHFGCECAVFPMFTAMLGSLGEADVAAHQIAGAINRTTYIFGAAVGEACCVLVSRALGAHQLAGAEAAVRAAVQVASAVMLALGLIFALGGPAFAHVFSDDQNVVRLISRLLWVAALYQLLDAVNIVMRAALRGAKDVRAAAVIGISILWTTVPTTMWLLGKVLGFGVVGGWFSFVLATALSAWFFSRRWYHGAWRLAQVPPPLLPGPPVPGPSWAGAAGQA